MIDVGRVKYDEMETIDRDALDLAIDLVLEEEPEMAETVRGYLTEGDWFGGATFAAYHRQCDHLTLAANETPPCGIDPDEIDAIISRGPIDNNSFGAARLAKKMLAAGVSIFHPQPITAIAAAKRARK